MQSEPLCPGCRHQLDVISASGRADDLFLCSRCYHSWFAFELESKGDSLAEDEAEAEEEDALR